MPVWYLVGGVEELTRLELSSDEFSAAVRAEFPDAELVQHGLGPSFDLGAGREVPVPVTWVDGMVTIEGVIEHAAEIAARLRRRIPAGSLVQFMHESGEGRVPEHAGDDADLVRRRSEAAGG